MELLINSQIKIPFKLGKISMKISELFEKKSKNLMPFYFNRAEMKKALDSKTFTMPPGLVNDEKAFEEWMQKIAVL